MLKYDQILQLIPNLRKKYCVIYDRSTTHKMLYLFIQFPNSKSKIKPEYKQLLLSRLFSSNHQWVIKAFSQIVESASLQQADKSGHSGDQIILILSGTIH